MDGHRACRGLEELARYPTDLLHDALLQVFADRKGVEEADGGGGGFRLEARVCEVSLEVGRLPGRRVVLGGEER